MTMTLLRMSDGIVFRVESGIYDLERIWSWAMSGCRLLEIQNQAGKLWLINPYQVIYLDGRPSPSQERTHMAWHRRRWWKQLLRLNFLEFIPDELPVLSGWLEQDHGLGISARPVL